MFLNIINVLSVLQTLLVHIKVSRQPTKRLTKTTHHEKFYQNIRQKKTLQERLSAGSGNQRIY
jgi:hypothetical protein